MNLTLSLDDRLLEEAREVARSMGKSVNQLVREHLEQLTSKDEAARDVDELERLSLTSGGRSKGWKFDREEIHQRS
jgi:uncharacterized Zn finger protein